MFTVLALVVSINAGIAQEKDELTTEQIQMVRDAVYSKSATTEFLRKELYDIVPVPKSLIEVYKQKPVKALEVLLLIMDGANPRDSVSAAAYAFELLEGPGAGVICLRVFKSEKYDVVDEDWKTTPRTHWIRHLRAAIKRDMEKRKANPG